MSSDIKNAVLRYGMVGGGEGSFIGDVHRKAVNLDGLAELKAGCFSRNFDNTVSTGKKLNLESDRLYRDFTEMAKAEAKRKDGIDFVSIVTPNASHYPIAKAFLENGINVVCDKPMTTDSSQSEELTKLASEKGLLFCVTYTYTGYPVVKHLRELISRGEIGDIRFVNAEYLQEWLATKAEDGDNKQASWRADPAQTGISNCVGDIGTHIENMVSYLTGLKIDTLCARLDSFVEGRSLDDNATVMVNYENGAKGVYWCSQVAVGSDNGLRVRIVGSKGSVTWAQENPNYAEVAILGQPVYRISRGRDELYPSGAAYSRVPSGHPEGYFEAFANNYKAFIEALKEKKTGREISAVNNDFQKGENGTDGVKFIEKCVESSRGGAVWIKLRDKENQ